ncbi:unnamed protein product (macronuclear) [Paramecium tetraurelia]|uniref:Uncharacterized protein n=1 Tax=Paramecium tetraurelia TaxID=5888 RepID=A0EDP0_PARTE|nr:uncharacterized protein GSPATT00025751001 [Paramecium tetraurelia]CAK93407.1 unnamed protein product [Paramecium tetraurelia]|eukprot:XP_001460804.1 hypothetical protein (macronuclear) [Paramecium tetraurelia strain d4-2]
MNSSQRRDDVISFNMLNLQVSQKWRKNVLNDVNINESDKKDNVNLDLPESLPKLEKEREQIIKAFKNCCINSLMPKEIMNEI